MKLAYWQPLPNEVVADTDAMRYLLEGVQTRAIVSCYEQGWIPIGAPKVRVSDQHADAFMRNESVLLLEWRRFRPRPGLLGWWLRKTKGRHVR